MASATAPRMDIVATIHNNMSMQKMMITSETRKAEKTNSPANKIAQRSAAAAKMISPLLKLTDAFDFASVKSNQK